MFEKLSKEIKRLVQGGRWSLYSVEGHDFFILMTKPYSACCNPNGKQEYYKIAADGGEIEKLPCVPDFKYVESIRFQSENLSAENMIIKLHR